jgi:hypothetical protein
MNDYLTRMRHHCRIYWRLDIFIFALMPVLAAFTHLVTGLPVAASLLAALLGFFAMAFW